MNRRFWTPCFIAVLYCSHAIAADLKIGEQAPQIELDNLSGKSVSWSDFKGSKATVIVFLAFDCPVAASYSQPLSELADQNKSRGVATIGVVPGNESADAIRKSAGEFKLTFPVFRDSKCEAAKLLGATTTPQAFVFDAESTLRYRGRIDDGYAARLKRNNQSSSADLKDAIAAVLEGKPIAKPITEPIGCPIVFPEAAPSTGAVTYNRDVAPILQTNCVTCHRPGEVGPFSLQTYEQAKKWASDIKDYTESRQMPPWMPRGGVEFKGERKLSDKDIATIATWVDAGAPAGTAQNVVAAAESTTGWRNGPPDLVLTVPDDFHLGATGRDVFRVFVLPTGLTENKWVAGYEVKPGNKRIVHHTLNFFDATGTGRAKDQKAKETADPLAADRGPGYSVGMGVGFFPPILRSGEFPKFGPLGGWAPGQAPHFVPEGCGWHLPAGSDLLVQVHYHRDGKPEIDRTQVGLYFAKTAVKQPWQTVVVPGMRPVVDYIPAGESHCVKKGAVFLNNDAVLHSVLPHMHLLGKSVKVTMTPPAGEPKVLVDIPEWNYNWQETYWFAQPIKVPAGTKLEIEAVYDNSTTNPNNPNLPPKDVYQGEQTTNEMLFGFLGVTSQKTPWERVRGGRSEAKK